MDVKLVWAKGFSRGKERMFDRMQTQIDADCIRYMLPLVPVGAKYYRNSGALRDSVRNPEPGKITFDAGPIKGAQSIAQKAYYQPMNHSRSGNPRATHLWFEYMKKEYGRLILRKVSGIAKKG